MTHDIPGNNDRLHEIIQQWRAMTEEYERDALDVSKQSREVLLMGALGHLAQLVDNYIEAQGDSTAREIAYRALFMTVRKPNFDR